MKKSKSFFEAVTALKAVTQTLFKKMPGLFLAVVYLIDLGIRSYLSAGWSTTYLLGVLILIISIGIYVSSKSLSETTLSFVLGVLTIYSIDWKKANITLFVILYLAYIVVTFYISAIRLTVKQESILIQAACKLDIGTYKEVYKRLKNISEKPTKYGQLSILDKCEIVRYLAFRQVIIGEYEEAINMIELIKNVCQGEITPCCEIYYGFYTYCHNQIPTPPNISKEVEKMFDKVTTLAISYLEFFEIFAQTKRILVEKKLSFDKYLFEIGLLALQGYSSTDISEIMREKYLKYGSLGAAPVKLENMKEHNA